MQMMTESWILKNCEVCKKEFPIRISALRYSPGRFCSLECKYQSDSGSAEQRFWAKVEKTDGCWNWFGYKRKGYGSIKVRGKAYPAHRFSYVMKFGPVPDELLVCHNCDNPSCVNPDHLFVGTSLDNHRDRENKGRHGYRFTEVLDSCPKCGSKEIVKAGKLQERFRVMQKLRCKICNRKFVSPTSETLITEKRHYRRLRRDEVEDIRLKLHSGLTQTLIASEYGISQETVSAISVGLFWKLPL